MSTIKKVIIALVLLILVGTGTFFGIKFYKLQKIDDEFYKNKLANLKLQKLELDEVRVEEGKYTEIETDQVKFTIPLENPTFKRGSTTDGEIVKATFENNRYVTYTPYSETSSEYEALQSLVEPSIIDAAKKFFGADIYSSSYLLKKTSYSYTLKDLSMSSSFSEIAACKIGLKLKDILMMGDPNKLYYFEIDKFKGFMYSGDTSIIIDIYPDDYTTCSLLIKNLTEDEAINILSSIEFK